MVFLPRGVGGVNLELLLMLLLLHLDLLSVSGEQVSDLEQFAFDGFELLGVRSALFLFKPDRLDVVGFTDQLLGPGNGVTLAVQKVLDNQDEFHILAPVEALPGAGPFWLDRGELAFPVPQDMGCHLREFADFAYLKIEFIRKLAGHQGGCPHPADNRRCLRVIDFRP
jgi:hypothetical protein